MDNQHISSIDAEQENSEVDRRKVLKMTGASVAALSIMSIIDTPFAQAQDMSNGADNFYKSDKLVATEVSFNNQYKWKVAGTMYYPKGLDLSARHPAIVVGHPMGAVRQQSANLYAQKMAEQGFVTLCFDLSSWGESEGQPRQAAMPDVFAEDFSACVDFLGTRPFVDRNRIGVLGICASGGFSISAAKLDPRMKAVATVSMYDMGGAIRDGIRHSTSLEQRKQMFAAAAEQRYVEFTGGKPVLVGGTTNQLTATTDPIQREFYDFYRTPRGEFTPVGAVPRDTTKGTLTSGVKFANFNPFDDIETISPRPLLFISGDQAHSREFSENAYRRAAEPKELYWVKGAGHVDLYDRVNLIPFNKLTSFFRQHLAAA